MSRILYALKSQNQRLLLKRMFMKIIVALLVIAKKEYELPEQLNKLQCLHNQILYSNWNTLLLHAVTQMILKHS